MSKIKKSYITSLEKSSVETVHGILDAKLEATNPEALTDYIGFSVGNIEDAISKMDKAISDLKQMKVNAKNQIGMIKEQSAKWLSDTGLDKLEGLIISSITINNPVATKKLVIHDRDCEFLKNKEFIKTSLDETAIKKFLTETEMDYSEFAEIEIIHNQPTLKINKKRG